MRITVEFTEWFKRFTGGKSSMEIEVEKGTTALSTLTAVGIPQSEIGFITVGKDGSGSKPKLVDGAYILEEGDSIKVYSFVIGG